MNKPISWLANSSLLGLLALVPTAVSPADDQARADTMLLTTEEIIVTAQFLEPPKQTNILDLDAVVGASENATNFGLATAVVGRPREWSLSIMHRF